MADRIVRAIITGNSAGAVLAFQETEAAAGKAATSAQTKFGALGTLMQNPWVKAGAAVATVAIGIGAVTTDMAAKFQTSMTLLETGAGEAEANLKGVSDGILAMAPQVGVMPAELASGMYLIESAGYHGAAGLTVLRTAAEGAKVGGADMATVADVLTSALNAYHLPASSAVAVTNDLIATVSVGKMHMQDLASAMGAIVPIAASLGVPLSQITGAMATMTMQGTDTSTAAQSLRFMLAALAGPTTKAAKEMEGLGIGQAEIPGITAATSTSLKALGLHASEVADTLSKQGLPAALAMITDALAKKFPPGSAAYEAALKGAVGGTRGLTAALELTGPSAATFAKNVESIGGATAKGGASVTGFARTQQDLGAQVDKAKAGLAAFGIHIGQVLLPVVTTLVQFFNEHVLPAFNTVFSTIQQHVPQIEAGFHNFGNAVNVVFTVAGNIITTVVGVIIAIIERVVVVIQAIVGPIQATVIRIGVIIGWIVTAVQGVINIVSGPVGTAFSLMSTAIGGVIGGIVAAIGKIVGAINGVITAIQTAIGWFTKLFQTASSQTTNTLTDAWNKANPGRPLPPNLQALVNATGHHASGGTIAAGAWGWTGEQGPEMVYGGTSGVSVFPQRAGGGAGASTINMHFYGLTPQDLPNAVVNALRRWQLSNGNLPIRVAS